MTELNAYQECRSLEGWQPVEVLSSDGVTRYQVLVNPWGLDSENVCECKGYVYTGSCRHQIEATNNLCKWSEIDGLAQPDEDRKNMKCPVCGGPSRWQIQMK